MGGKKRKADGSKNTGVTGSMTPGDVSPRAGGEVSPRGDLDRSPGLMSEVDGAPVVGFHVGVPEEVISILGADTKIAALKKNIKLQNFIRDHPDKFEILDSTGKQPVVRLILSKEKCDALIGGAGVEEVNERVAVIRDRARTREAEKAERQAKHF